MSSLTTVPTEVPRDRWGRPLVTPPDGGKPVAYTRATTFIDCIEDKFNLQKWMQRMVALGLSDRPDLRIAVAAHRDDKRELDKLCDQAREAAAASGAATTGTALHALTEVVDRGQDLPTLEANAVASLEKYREATADLKAVHIEQFCVLDTLRIGGTPDRIVEYGGKRYIADVKTGRSIEWGTLKIAAQLAVYARSHTYDHATRERGIHEASTTRGIVIHLPAVEDPADARCELHWMDLEAGWHAVQTAKDVREKRKLKFTDLTEPFGAPERPSLHAQKKDEQREAVVAEGEDDKVRRMIGACTTPDEVRDLWTPEWTDDLVAAAKQRVAELTERAS